jgi:molybdate transport system substrate-binding protein
MAVPFPRSVRALVVSASSVGASLALNMGSAGCHRSAPVSAQPIKVAAAADLAFAFPEVGALYEKTTGEHVVFSFGSTGLLERQIAEGAPFDAFAAASASFADDAVASGACLADSKASYAIGRIVLLAGSATPSAPATLADLDDPRFAKIAIANPEHAPYGRAAKQALERAGIWEKISSRIVYGENVQQTLQFAQSGNADAAIVAMSLVAGLPAGDGGARWSPIPEELHERIDQVLVACSRGAAGPDAGRRFIAFVRSDAGRGVLRRYGFL